MKTACCGADCDACTYPDNCPGCRETAGKPFWTAYVHIPVCPVYNCCVRERGQFSCGGCPNVPCKHHFAYPDPYMSQEDRTKTLEKKMENLRKYHQEFPERTG